MLISDSGARPPITSLQASPKKHPYSSSTTGTTVTTTIALDAHPHPASPHLVTSLASFGGALRPTPLSLD